MEATDSQVSTEHYEEKSQVSTEHYDGKSQVTTSVEHYDGSQTTSGVKSRVAENGERNVKNLPLSPDGGHSTVGVSGVSGVNTTDGVAGLSVPSRSMRSVSVSSTVSEADSYMFDVSSTTGIITGEQEYETQFLGFAPKSFCDGLYNAVLDYTWEYFKASQVYIQSEFGDVVSKDDLDQASRVFLSKASQSIDKAFDKFETYILSNILSIPGNVVLPEDRIQEDYKSFSKTEENILDDEIYKLKDRIIAAKCVNATLRQEFKHARELQKEYSQLVDLLTKLDRTMRQSTGIDVQESLVFTVEKSNKVIDLLREIQRADQEKRPLPGLSELEAVSKRLKKESES